MQCAQYKAEIRDDMYGRLYSSLYLTGCAVDFTIRAVYEGLDSWLGPWQDTYCSAWMCFYKINAHLFNVSGLAVALFRYFTIKYPIEYHNR